MAGFCVIMTETGNTKQMKKFFLAFTGILLLASIFAVIAQKNPDGTGNRSPWIASVFANKNQGVVSFRITKGKIFADIARAFGIDHAEMSAIIDNAKHAYNLEKIVEGKEMSVFSDELTGELEGLVYQIDSEEVLVAAKNASGTWIGERKPIPYEIKPEEIAGTIDSSLFLAITEAGGDERVALALAEMFAWQIDFGADIRQGDSFRAIYEKRSLNGNYVAPGNILAAKFVNDGREFKGVYFKGSDGKEGYYDLDGLSLQKIFLKSPLSYKYISSGFSYSRLNPITRSDWGPHRAIDYAAPQGTPAVTVGDGTVASAGWNGALGIAAFVRHNDTYTTVYAHLSKSAVRTGSRVKQGQVVGYVGATGDTTGPHLHFELRKFGTRVNPLTIELPPGDPILEQDRETFQKTLNGFRNFFAS